MICHLITEEQEDIIVVDSIEITKKGFTHYQRLICFKMCLPSVVYLTESYCNQIFIVQSFFFVSILFYIIFSPMPIVPFCFQMMVKSVSW